MSDQRCKHPRPWVMIDPAATSTGWGVTWCPACGAVRRFVKDDDFYPVKDPRPYQWKLPEPQKAIPPGPKVRLPYRLKRYDRDEYGQVIIEGISNPTPITSLKGSRANPHQIPDPDAEEPGQG